MEKYGVNKQLLSVKIHYFLINGAHAGVITFIPIYAVQLGISAAAIGIILAILCCLTVISKPILGGVVDRFQKLHQVLLFLILVDVGADLGLNFIPKPYQTPINTAKDNLFCYHNNSYVLNLKNSSDCQNFNYSNFKTDLCFQSCALCEVQSVRCLAVTNETYSSEISNVILNHTVEDIAECSQNEENKCTDACFDGSDLCTSILGTDLPLQLWLLSLFVGIIYVSNGSIVSLSDAACYNALGDCPQNFGKQRLWGTIGWGTFALLTGYLNQVFTGNSKIYSYSSGFYMLVIIFAIDVVVIRKLRFKGVTISKNICKDVSSLLLKPKIQLFILTTFGIGILTGISRSYLYWYLRTTLGASQLLLGCASGIQCFFGELPFFFFSGFIISKLGHINTFTMSFLSYGVKFLIHSFLTNPWWALPVELLQGPCFGSFYSAMTSYSMIISPTGTEATMQGIVSGTFEGIGVATGSLLGGLSIGYFGGRQTFYWTGLISLFTGVIQCLVYFIQNCRNQRQEIT